jgi:hypothetical protein
LGPQKKGRPKTEERKKSIADYVKQSAKKKHRTTAPTKTPAMANHKDLINYTMKVGTMIYDEGCKQLTTEFDMKSSGAAVYITKLQAKCVKMGWQWAPSKSSTLPTPWALPST